MDPRGDRKARPDPKRIAVLGANGMAGHLVSEHLDEAGHTVTRVARRRRPGANWIELDILDFAAVRRLLAQEFDYVVNCIGMLVSASESDHSRAIELNSYLPHVLAAELSHGSTRLIHLSTDCVFSGTDGPYTERSFPNGRSFYDRTKALGEIINDRDLTIRTSIIGPEINPRGVGLMHWFLGQTGVVNGYTGAIWNGITTLELSKAICAFMDTSITGIYHVTPQETISKYDLLSMMAEHFERSDILIRSERSVRVNRALLDTRHEVPLVIAPCGYEGMMNEMRHWVSEHAELYGTDSRYRNGGSYSVLSRKTD
jgi:dTDP-4-dehydrorhamnose reductase